MYIIQWSPEHPTRQLSYLLSAHKLQNKTEQLGFVPLCREQHSRVFSLFFYTTSRKECNGVKCSYSLETLPVSANVS